MIRDLSKGLECQHFSFQNSTDSFAMSCWIPLAHLLQSDYGFRG